MIVLFKKHSNNQRGVEIYLEQFLSLIKELANMFYGDQTDKYETDKKR